MTTTQALTRYATRCGKSAVGVGLVPLTVWMLVTPATPVQAKRPNIVNDDAVYTEIGRFDENLSKLCTKKLFNQHSQLRYSAYFKKDKVLLGGATGTGWNLKDPTGARRFDRDYWFRADGFSTCEVYYSLNPRRPASGEAAKAAPAAR